MGNEEQNKVQNGVDESYSSGMCSIPHFVYGHHRWIDQTLHIGLPALGPELLQGDC